MPEYPGFEPAHPTPPARPVEDLVRGTVFAAIAIPLGVLLWLIIWNFGVVASIVAWLVAFAAGRLYALGAGHPTRRGAWIVVAVTVVTLVLAFLGGMWLDMVKELGLNPVDAVFDTATWGLFADNLTNNAELWSAYTKDILMAAAFCALGCFFTLRRIFAASATS
ncbi:hypothetical protein [Specibacter cremeus]|uniref:hypothetical protein n=1 Tax=Specibacter cremeus TaxID=1629051 RepID=UPI000F7805BC|nr:hypothetical protein [Specibacter cremeus]